MLHSREKKHTYWHNWVESKVCVAFICLLRMNVFALNIVTDITLIDLRRGKSKLERRCLRGFLSFIMHKKKKKKKKKTLNGLINTII